MALGGVKIDQFGRPQNYTPPPPPPPPPAAAQQAAPPAPPVADTSGDALTSLTNYLNTYGLAGFAGQAWSLYKQGVPNDQILSDLRASDAYKQIFGTNAADLLKKGIFGNERDILTYYNTARGLFHAYGIPDSVASEYTNPDALNTLALGNVSPDELKQRLSDAQQAMTASLNPETRAELQRTLGATTGDLTGIWLNPNAKLPDLENRLQAGIIGGIGDRAGYGQVDVNYLMQLAAQGVTSDQARSGFSTLAQEQQLFGPLAGTNEAAIGQETQIGSAFSGGQDALLVEQRRQARLAQFNAGGQFASTAQGVQGLGVNQS